MTHEVREGRGAWVHVARGEVDLGGTRLQAGDAAEIDEPSVLALVGTKDAEVLLFDLG